MKKIVITIMIFVILNAFIIHNTSHADKNAVFTEGGIEVLQETHEEIKLNSSIKDAGAEMVGIEARFCNNSLEKLTKKLTGKLGQNEQSNICVLIKNNSKFDAKVNLAFADQTSSSFGIPICNGPNNGVFGGFVDQTNSQIKIPSNDYIIKHFKIKFPIGISGKQGGCLFYNVEKENAGEQMVNIIVGKAMFIDYFVGDLSEITNEIKLSIINKKIINNELILDIGIKNLGNIDLQVGLSGVLTNILGIDKNMEANPQIIRTQASKIFSLNFGQLPNYKGLFKINITAHHTPYFDFELDDTPLDPQILATKESTISTTYFEIPRAILGITLVIIILLILVLKKPKQKIIYVDKKE